MSNICATRAPSATHWSASSFRDAIWIIPCTGMRMLPSWTKEKWVPLSFNSCIDDYQSSQTDVSLTDVCVCWTYHNAIWSVLRHHTVTDNLIKGGATYGLENGGASSRGKFFDPHVWSFWGCKKLDIHVTCAAANKLIDLLVFKYDITHVFSK